MVEHSLQRDRGYSRSHVVTDRRINHRIYRSNFLTVVANKSDRCSRRQESKSG
ncbi:hypothetical protein HAX54_049315, partial [Datura stramonium]|nr:hypothetical protein [Datura stramonium]